MVPVLEGVLRVELKLVHAQEIQDLHQSLERRGGRDPVAAHVEHEAANGEVGPVADDETGKLAAGLAPHLLERRPRVALCVRVGRANVDAARADLERVPLGREGGVGLDARVEWRTRLDAQARPDRFDAARDREECERHPPR